MCVCVCTWVCICACLRMYMCVNVHVCMDMSVHMCLCVWMCMCACTWMCECMCVRMWYMCCLRVCIRICTWGGQRRAPGDHFCLTGYLEARYTAESGAGLAASKPCRSSHLLPPQHWGYRYRCAHAVLLAECQESELHACSASSLTQHLISQPPSWFLR